MFISLQKGPQLNQNIKQEINKQIGGVIFNV